MKTKLIFLLFLLLSGCIDQPVDEDNLPLSDVIHNEEKIVSFDNVMRRLPNIVDVRRSVDIVVYGKLKESDVRKIKVEILQGEDKKIIYKGSLLGIMTLPKKRVRVPVNSSSNLFYGKFIDEKERVIFAKLDILDSRELVVRSKHFSIPTFQK